VQPGGLSGMSLPRLWGRRLEMFDEKVIERWLLGDTVMEFMSMDGWIDGC
jgi:hypothetical protein